MIDDIYNRDILRLAATMPHIGALADPDASAQAYSRLCGSKVKVDLKMDGDVISDFAQEVKACALGQAASSIVGAHVIGSTAAEMQALEARMRAMLKENGPPPDGKWADLALLEPVRNYQGRHASTMLIFEAVNDAIDQIRSARPAGAS